MNRRSVQCNHDDDAIESIPNLGKVSAEMIRRAGIATSAAVRELGAVLTYVAVVQSGARPSKNLLWSLAAGLQDRNWNSLTAAEKLRLESEVDQCLGSKTKRSSVATGVSRKGKGR